MMSLVSNKPKICEHVIVMAATATAACSLCRAPVKPSHAVTNHTSLITHASTHPFVVSQVRFIEVGHGPPMLRQ